MSLGSAGAVGSSRWLGRVDEPLPLQSDKPCCSVLGMRCSLLSARSLHSCNFAAAAVFLPECSPAHVMRPARCTLFFSQRMWALRGLRS